MSALSSSEQQVWKKVLAAKNKAMNELQIQTSFPGMGKKDVTQAIGNLLKHQLLTTGKGKDGATVFHGVQAEDAKKKATLTTEQSTVVKHVQRFGNRGVSVQPLRREIGTDIITVVALRKALEVLEKGGHLKTFRSVQAPAVPLYIAPHFKPPEELTGGIWFDSNKDYDGGFVDIIYKLLLTRVRQLTFPTGRNRTPHQQSLVPNPIFPANKTSKLPSPHQLLKFVNSSGAINIQLRIDNVMEIMRALELDGLVEAVKPLGGVDVPSDGDDGGSDDDEPMPKKKKRADSDDDLDEEEKMRRAERAREKEKERMKDKKRREKERERDRLRREKEKKRKEKRRKRKRDKEKKRRKRVMSESASDSDEEDSEPLVSIHDEPKSKSRLKSKSKSSSRKRKHSPSSSASSDSGSGSGSDSGSNSDSDIASVSSIRSSELDTSLIHPKSRGQNQNQTQNLHINFNFATPFTDLTHKAIVYRATNRFTAPLGQTEVSCGKCPQFGFCQEGGPVNAETCVYLDDWLSDVRGGWDEESKRLFWPERYWVDNGDEEKEEGEMEGEVGEELVGMAIEGV